ncbi:MAG: dolichol-phosphate mannosyltransferase [Verrucomicrobiota bacterium]|jgi:dolichol-phosphate mannosyltransferase
MSSSAKIWVVLPAYNEQDALPLLLDSVIENLGEESKDFSVIVVNDGSEDRTGDVANDYAARAPVIALHQDANKGLAETMRRGLMDAVQRAGPKDIIVTMDADNTHPAGLALRMIRLIREGNDVVIASRYREGSQVRGIPLYRSILSRAASWLFRIFFPIRGVRDYTCGYRAYRADVMKRLIDRYGREFISERGFSCMVDILLRLRECDLVFAEVPLVLRYNLKPGRTKMRVMQTIVDTLKLLVRRRFGRV